jgi:hypothetical protein
MASDTPTDAPRTGEPTPPSESPANVSARRRRKPQPHHRPISNVFGATPSDPIAMIEVVRAPRPGVREHLVALLVELLDERRRSGGGSWS